MRSVDRLQMAFALLMVAAATCIPTAAQEKTSQPPARPATTYDLLRELTLVGTVISFTQSSSKPPLGAHVNLQTAAGVLDVHLGDPRLLVAQQFTIQPGDTLRIIGETLTAGDATQFVARIVQNGTQVLAVRSPRGFPLSFVAPRNMTNAKSREDVL